MAKLDDLPQAVKEALGYFEAFRCMGFSSDDIYFGVAKGEAKVVLRSQGLQFICDAGLLPAQYHTAEAAAELWKKAAEFWNDDKNDKERKSVWEFSDARRNAVDLIAAVIDKGFYLKQDPTELLN